MFLGILVFIICIIIINAAYKPKRKSQDYYLHHPELNRTVEYFAPAAYSDSLVRFMFKNRMVYLQRKDGKTLAGKLENLLTTFTYFKYRGASIFSCTVSHKGQKLSFSWYGDKEAFWDILDILSHSGSVSGQDNINLYKSDCELKGAVKDTVKSFFGQPTSSTPDLKGALKNTANAYLGIKSSDSSQGNIYENSHHSWGNPVEPQSDITSRLRNAKELYDAGLIDETEFIRMKQNIIQL